MIPHAKDFLLSGLWEWDLTLKQIFISDAAKEICEINISDPPLISTVRKLFRERPHLQRILEAIKRAKNEVMLFDLHLHITTAAGHQKRIRLMGQSVWSQGHIVRIFGSIQDIDHTSELINRMKGSLKNIAYIQSHELRKPVASILGLIHCFQLDDFEIGSEEIEMLNKSALELDGKIKTIMQLVGNVPAQTQT